MAIQQTRSVQRIEIYPSNAEGAKPTVMVVYQHTFDDTEDDQLPITTDKVVYLTATTVDATDPENPVTTATDVTGHDSLVQAICAAVWAE